MSFLVFASPKSGTTWLQRLISCHPEALCAESRAFGDYFDPKSLSTPHLTVEKFVNVLSCYHAPAVPQLETGRVTYYRTLLFNVLDTIGATALSATAKSVYGEKFTPYPGTAKSALEVLREYHPQIKFVNLTRDGRDVVVSGAVHWLNLRLRGASEADKPRFEEALRERRIPDAEFQWFTQVWIEAVSAGLKAQSLFAHYLPVRYERFLSQPETEAAQLFSFLGLDATPRIVRSCVDAAAFDKLSGGRQPGDEDRHSFFRKGEAGDWRNWFTPDQEREFEERAGYWLKQLGYA